ncbi:hypothetical protein HXX76_013956 [Chlamydomonas incerta]|uniref:Polymorphic outer membrane protein n=1 Tax=Chlamydomonas incerta TaxID=51695 RepID=A0A835VTE8_CHLIN|nr:hypothetical protein HXX76_013956 [Chlamydomonas incerta]|eukprot:KAG2425203.1 hypothetical protein HXX76_013956 [Chlamydomonas incerta]
MSDVHVSNWVPPPLAAAEDSSEPPLAAVHVVGGKLVVEGCSWEGLGLAASSDSSSTSSSTSGGSGGADESGSGSGAGNSPPSYPSLPHDEEGGTASNTPPAEQESLQPAGSAGTSGAAVGISATSSAVSALYVAGAETVTLRRCTFANISSSNAGITTATASTAAAVRMTVAGAAAGGSFITVEGCEWRDVSATAAALLVDGAGSLTISTSAFKRCSPGGAMHVSGVADVAMRAVVFAQNSASLEGVSGGGALRLSSCPSVALAGCTFTANDAAGAGGAVLMSQGTALRITGGVFENNSAAGGPGGAAAALMTSGAEDGFVGGACSLTLLGVMLRGNTAAGASELAGGGAVYMPGGGSVFLANDTELWANTAAEGPGGAVACGQGTTLAMHNCTLVANSARVASGGAVWADARSSVTLRSSRLLNNSAALDGGAVAVSRALLRLASCALVGNTAEGGSGGAVSVDNCANCGESPGALEVVGPARILGCEVAQNGAAQWGGGIHYVGGRATMCARAPCANVSTLQVRRDPASSLSPSGIAYTRLADNVAGAGGGALYARFAQTVLDNALVERNRAPSGGALFLDGGAVLGSLAYSGYMANVTFRGNGCGAGQQQEQQPDGSSGGGGASSSSAQQAGGALYATRADGGLPWQLVLNTSSFEDNACSHGGAVAIVGDLALLSVTWTNFSRNSARGGGGARGGAFLLTSGAASTPQPTGAAPPRAQFMDSGFVSNNAVLTGGAIEVSGTWMLLSSRSNFSSNAAGVGGGAVMVSGCTSRSSLLATTAGIPKENARFLSGVFQSNTASRGGALRVDGCNVTVYESRFVGNSATDTGGAILAANANLGTLTGLQVVGTAFQSNRAALSGGAVAVTSQGVSATNCSFSENIASNLGGAIYAYEASPQALRKLPARQNGTAFSADERTLLQVSIQATLFDRNTAVDEGGALALEQVSFTSTGNTYLGNSAGDGLQTSVTSDSGGAVYASACIGYATFDHDALSGNFANGGHGGALLLTGCPAVVLESRLDNNTAAGGSGGAIHSVSIQRNTGSNDSSTPVAAYTGAGSNSSVAVAIAGQSQFLSIAYSSLTGNAADDAGGAVFTSGVAVQLIGSQCSANRAGGRGGALAATLTPLVDVADSSFTENQAAGEGGAVSCTGTALALLRGCVFQQNTAGGQGGGAVAADSARCLLSMGSQYAGNRAELGDGGAVWLQGLGASGRRGRSSTGQGRGSSSNNDQDTWCSDQLRAVVLPPESASSSNNSTRRRLGAAAAAAGAPFQRLESQGSAVLTELGGAAAGLLLPAAAGGAGVAQSAPPAPLAALFVNDTLSGNAALRSGGAVLVAAAGARARLLLDAVRVLDNLASSSAGGGVAVAQELTDVAMQLEVFVASSRLHNNAAVSGAGGAVRVQAASRHQQVAILNTTLTANTAAEGGAVAVAGNVSLLVGAGSRLAGNAATGGLTSGGGGGILAKDCNEVTVDDAAFLNNSAPGGSGGAALFSGCGAVAVQGAVVSGNAALHGGGLAVSGARTVEAGAPGFVLRPASGVLVPQPAAGALAPLIIRQAPGAIALVLNSSFTNNTAIQAAEGVGGALLISGRAAALLSQTSFERNRASLHGGGIAIQSTCEARSASNLPHQLLAAALPEPTAFPSAQRAWARTLATLQQQTRVPECWQTVADRLSFYGNQVQGVGGSVYVERRELLSLACDDSGNSQQQGQQQPGPPATAASTAVASSGAAAIDNNVSDAAFAERLASGSTAPLILGTESLQRCYQLPAAAGGADAAGIGAIGALTASDATEGYGDFVGLPVSGLRVNSIQALDTSATGAAAESSQGTLDEAHAPQFTSSARTLLDPRTGVTFTERRYTLTASSSLPLHLSIDLLDGLEQVARTREPAAHDGNGSATAAPLLVVRAALYAASSSTADVVEPPCGAQLVGTAGALARNGTASLQGLRLRAMKSDNYTLALTLSAGGGSAALPVAPSPVIIALTVPPCRLGEVPRDGGYLCEPCDPLSFSLWQDTQPLAACAYANATDITCAPCPDAAECPGGAVLFPSAGAWHSAANSTHVAACPTDSACRAGDEDAQTVLLNCQQWWYSRPLGFNYSAFAASVLANDSRAFPLAPGALPDGGYNYSDPALCVLWGLPPDHPAAYMQKQCSPGYSGTLCGVCVLRDGMRTTNNANLQCKACAPLVVARVVFTLAVLSSIGMCVFTCFVTYFDDYTEEEDIAAGDMLGVILRHLQYFYMLSRLDLNWPTSVTAVGAVFGAVTGAIRIGAASATCILPYHPSPEQQARAEVATELLVPAVSLAAALAVWTVRYFVWNARTINGFHQKDLRTVEEAHEARQRGGMAALARSDPASSYEWGGHGEGDDGGRADTQARPSPVRALGPQLDDAALEAVVAVEAAAVVEAAPAAEAADEQCVLAAPASPVAHPAAANTIGSPASADAAAFASVAIGMLPAREEPDAVTATFTLRKPKAAATTAGQQLRRNNSSGLRLFTGGSEGGRSGRSSQGGLLEGRLSTPRSLAAGAAWLKGFFTLDGDRQQQARWVSLINVDNTLGLAHQLWLVAVITTGVLFPAWAQASLQIFSCYKVDPGTGPWPETQLATWGQGYWTRNMNQRCYAGEHSAVWVPVGITAVVAVCVGIPAMSFAAIFAHRHNLESVHVVQTYGFIYRRYNPNRHYWQVVTQLQTLLIVVVEVFGQSLSTVSQAVLQQVVLVLAMTLNSWFQPTKLKELADIEFLSFAVLTLTTSLGMLCIQQSNPEGSLSAAAVGAVGVLVLLLNAGLVTYLSWFTLMHTRDNVTRAMNRVRQRAQTVRSLLSRSLSGIQDRVRKSSTRAVDLVRRVNGGSPRRRQEAQQAQQREEQA